MGVGGAPQQAVNRMQVRPARQGPTGMLVQAILVDGRPTRLVAEGDPTAIKMRFADPDRLTEILVWTPLGKKALAFKPLT